MAKKSGLGRGLSNLIPGSDREDERFEISSNPDYREIPIQNIHPNPDQPRKSFPEEEIQELAKTLHSVGLIEPVVVRKLDGEDYQLISGERRWRASKIAGFKKIPAVIKQVDDIAALEMGIIENIQREELNPIEEARAYETWMNRTGEKPAAIAARVGKDRSTITNLTRLLKLPDEILEMIEKKMITAGQARPLLAIGDRRQMSQIVGKIVREGWSTRKIEEEVSSLLDGGSSGSGKSSGDSKGGAKDPNVRSLEEKIRRKLSSKVGVQYKRGGGGKITIHYGNLDDLDRILELMGIK